MNVDPMWQVRGALYRCLLILGLAFWCSRCTPLDMIPGCDQGSLAAIVAECRTRVRAECDRGSDGLPESSCPVLQDCDKRIDTWEECR